MKTICINNHTTYFIYLPTNTYSQNRYWLLKCKILFKNAQNTNTFFFYKYINNKYNFSIIFFSFILKMVYILNFKIFFNAKKTLFLRISTYPRQFI